MKERFEVERKMPNAETPLLKCIWMLSGTVNFKLCDREYDCDQCAFYQAWLSTGPKPQGVRVHEPHRSPAGDERVTHGWDREDKGNFGGRFVHPMHLWARIEDEGKVRIGLDDFAQRLLGRVYSVRFPSAENRTSDGNPCWWIAHGSGETRFPIPIKGTMEEGNEKLTVSPSLINQDPYGEGWVLTVRPDNLEGSLKQFLYGQTAHLWYEREYQRLNLELVKSMGASNPNLGPTLQDGGKPIEHFVAELSPDDHRKLITMFLIGGLQW